MSMETTSTQYDRTETETGDEYHLALHDSMVTLCGSAVASTTPFWSDTPHLDQITCKSCRFVAAAKGLADALGDWSTSFAAAVTKVGESLDRCADANRQAAESFAHLNLAYRDSAAECSCYMSGVHSLGSVASIRNGDTDPECPIHGHEDFRA